MPEQTIESLAAIRDHSRLFSENRFVYPVLSRRSRGISLGINLNPDKICNFDCIYCQVDRRTAATTRFVETDRLLDELNSTLALILSGELYAHPLFAEVPPLLRRLNDIAFSGDGEPTTFRNFDEIVADVARIKTSRNLDDVKLVLITNASMFHRPHVRRALHLFDQNQGEIWAKLDAGTDSYYHIIERTPIPFQRILDNLLEVSRARPLVIQSLFLRLDGQGPSALEIDAYCDRLTTLLASGGNIDRVQVYTVARRPAEDTVTPLPADEVDALAARVRHRVGIPVEAYHGPVG